MKKIIQNYLLVAFCFLGISNLWAQYAGPANPNIGTNLSSGLIYTHPQGVFTMQFPQGWIQSSPTDTRQVAYFIYAQGGTSLAETAVYIEMTPQTMQPITPQVYAVAVEQNTLRNTPGYQKGAETTLTLNGQLVVHRQFTYTTNIQGQMKTVQAEHYYFVVGNLAYVLHFATYPEFFAQVKGQFDQIAQSFRISGIGQIPMNYQTYYNPYTQTYVNPNASLNPYSTDFLNQWIAQNPYAPPPAVYSHPGMQQYLDNMIKQWQQQNPLPTLPPQGTTTQVANPYGPQAQMPVLTQPTLPTQQATTNFTITQNTPLGQQQIPQNIQQGQMGMPITVPTQDATTATAPQGTTEVAPGLPTTPTVQTEQTTQGGQ